MLNDITIGIQPISWENEPVHPHELGFYMGEIDQEIKYIEKKLEDHQGIDKNGRSRLEDFRRLVNHRKHLLVMEINNLIKEKDYTKIKKNLDDFIKNARSSYDFLINDHDKYLNNHQKVNEKISAVSNSIKSKCLDTLNFDDLNGLISSEDKKTPSKIEKKQQIKPIQQSTTPHFKIPQIRPKNKKDE